MRKREPGRIGEPVRFPVYDLRHHRQSLHSTRADAVNQQQLGKIRRAAFRSCGQSAAQPALEHVRSANVVMRGHDEVRQQGLSLHGFLLSRVNEPELARDSVWSERLQQFELLLA